MVRKRNSQNQCRQSNGGICRDWGACPGKEFYSPSEIVYCPHQVRWIIEYFLEIKGDQIVSTQDRWLPEAKETGYIDAALTQHSISMHAPYEMVKIVSGDVLRRLSKTGKDGRLLVLEVHNELPVLSEDARNALGYVNGWKEKHTSYSKWLRNRRFYHKERGIK